MEKGLDLIKTVMNRVKTRYEKILEDYYPSYDSIGFTERNLTYNFCSQFEQVWNESSLHEKNLVIWQEAPIKNGDKKDEHIDSLIIDGDFVYLVEAKRLNGLDKIGSIGDDIDRMKKIAAGEYLLRDLPKNANFFLIVLVDFWLPRLSDNQKTKNELRQSFFEHCMEQNFSVIFNAEVCPSKNISNSEHYYLMSAVAEYGV